jgi:hypothetical protein
MLSKILKKFDDTLKELDNFITSEGLIKNELVSDVKFINLSIKKSGEDIAKANRVKNKIAKLID